MNEKKLNRACRSQPKASKGIGMAKFTFSFRPKLWDVLASYRAADLWQDLPAGITVGVVALPLAMAFAIASGLKPEAGIFTAIIAGFIISTFGGSRVQIGGPAGAFIVIVNGIVVKYGVDGLIVATLMSGVFLFMLGLLRLGILVRFVPVAIVIGFTNGIAVLIALSQIKDVLGLKMDSLPADFFPRLASLAAHVGTIDPATVVLSLASLLIVFLWPVLAARTGIKALRFVPGSIIALAAGTAAVALFKLPVETIGTRFGGIPSSLPSPVFPTISLSVLQNLVPPAITITLLGAIESLLCARVADGLIDDRHDPNQELMAQGLANLAAPLLGGYCATGTIARTVTNIRSGARTPVAGIIHAVTLLCIILVAAPLARNVPLATLGAILLFVSYNMGEWHEFARLRQFAVSYRVVLLATFILTVVVDLTVAVEVGLLLAFLFFAARMSNLTRLEPVPEIEMRGHAPDSVVVSGQIEAYRLYGTLFFGAVHKLEELMDPARKLPEILVLSLTSLINIDASGLEILENLLATLRKRNCRLLIAGVNGQPLRLMTDGGFIDEIGRGALFESTAQAFDHVAALLQKKAT
jgi:SulP family sulfate permease